MTPSGGSLRQAGKSISKLAAGEAVNKITRFVAAVILARTLSLSDFGIVNVGIAIAGILLTLTALGMPEYGARQVAVAPRDARRVAGVVLSVRVGALAGIAFVMIGATAIALSDQLVLITLSVAMAVGLSTSGDWLLRGREQMADAAGATALGGIVVLVGCGSLVLLLPTATAALIVFVMGEASAAAATWWRAKLGRVEMPSWERIKQVVVASWPLGASGIIIYASYANLDSILLAILRSDAEAGLYSAPYRLFLAANAVTLFAAYSLLPMLSRSHHEGRLHEKRSLLLRAFTPLAGYGLIVLGAAELIGGAVLEGLFGADFADTGPLLILLCMSLPIYSIGYPAGYSLIGEQRNWQFFVGGAIAGGLNIALMSVLIPLYGTYGAAIATTVGLFGGALAWLVLSRSLRASAPLVAGVVLATLLGIPASTGITLAIPIGAATLLCGVIMFLAPVVRARSRNRTA